MWEQQRQEFEERGFARISGAFPRVDAAAMEDRIWAAMGEKGVVRDDPATWSAWGATGLQPVRDDPVFQAIGSAATLGVLDECLGEGLWQRPRNWGQFLVSFPAADRAWNVPSVIWHTDFGFWPPTDRVTGALVFCFFTDVVPRSGGTAVVAGSPRLVAQFVETQPREVREKMKRARRALYLSDPWLGALTSNGDDPERVERFMEADQVVSGIPVRVVELTGSAGDVVVCHPWLLHATAPNCGDRPTMRCVQRVHVTPGP